MEKIGDLGEKLVKQWLETQDWKILHHHWHCRWGEIDLIAEQESNRQIIFVEVKTRGQNNWDDNGLLAINPKKQLKISRTAATFLAKSLDFSEYFCRFDVGLVTYKKTSDNNLFLERNSSILIEAGYQFYLDRYLESAFDLSSNF